ncbi:MAG: hypothetical protein Q4D76_10290, partial [Oscillospiraceae bacterium]|nr:hypothetical protein [Oscillospiraceae bacterium]
ALRSPCTFANIFLLFLLLNSDLDFYHLFSIKIKQKHLHPEISDKPVLDRFSDMWYTFRRIGRCRYAPCKVVHFELPGWTFTWPDKITLIWSFFAERS